MNCHYCEGTGKYQKPLDEAGYAVYCDMFYDSGLFNEKMARDMALLETGYEVIPCPFCEHGAFTPN
jgi:thymidylate kinase